MKSASSKHRILVVEDQPVVREGIARMLGDDEELAVCGETADPAEALERITALKPSVVITDLELLNNGVDFVKAVRDRAPNARLLVFSQKSETLHARRALAAGANGYLMRNQAAETLREAVRRLIDGKTYVSREVNERLISSLSSSPEQRSATIDDLSDRERQVMSLIGHGYGSRQIADQLHMSIKTVETHRQHIKAKLRLESTFQLVQLAIDWVHHQGGGVGAAHRPIA